MPIRPVPPEYSPLAVSGSAASDRAAVSHVLLTLLCARVGVLEAENGLLHRRVRELTIDRDDLLDAANVHALCAHEERLIALVRYYDRPYR